MRYNAFFGELPINAFKPRAGGGMTLHGGGNPLSAVTDAISDVAGGVGDVVSGVAGAVSDVGSQFDDFVNTELPGGWTTAALLAAGYYYAPEIGAYMNASGSVVPASEVAGGAVATPVTQGAVTGTALGELGAAGTLGAEAALSPVVAGNVGSMGAVAPVVAETAAAGGLGAATGALGAGAAGAAGSNALSGMLPYMVGGQVATGLLGANAAKEAADIQSAAAQNATALQGQMFNTINQQQAPYRTAGYGALNQIGGLGGGEYTTYDASGKPTGTAQGSGYLTKQFDASDLQKGLAPNYDFMLQQGQMANQRAANMGGGALGGNALQGLNRYTQDYAGNAYQNAFNNYQNQRSNIYNTLAGIAGIGQTGQSATNAAAANATNAATSLGIGSAAAQAAGQVGSTNALANTVGNVGNTYMLSQLLNQGGRVPL
jgi:hypothetical protein